MLLKYNVQADWQYNVTDGLIESSKLFKDKGFDVICCPFDSRLNNKLCIDSVVEFGLFGFMKTTWHTLSTSNMAQLTQVGLGAYEGYYNNDYPIYSVFVDRAGGILRKVSPETEYENCGWKQKQIEV